MLAVNGVAVKEPAEHRWSESPAFHRQGAMSPGGGPIRGLPSNQPACLFSIADGTGADGKDARQGWPKDLVAGLSGGPGLIRNLEALPREQTSEPDLEAING